MSSQMQKPQLDKVREHKRVFWANPFVVIIVLLLLLLITVSTLLILSDLGILVLTWSNNLSTVFVGIILPALAIIVTLAQWLHSLSSHKEHTSSPRSHDHLGSTESHINSSGLLKSSPADEKRHTRIFGQAVSSPPTQAHNEPPSIDWGEAPDTGQFYGREKELLEVKKWAGEDHCKMVSVIGMGGIGKTSLVVEVVDQIQQDFASIFWRSVQNAPPLQHLLQSCIQFLSDQKQATVPEGIDEQILLLIECLRKKRCLLILDNYESLLQSENQTGLYRDGYEGYGTLIKRIGDMKHQSCLIITSREKPREIALMEGNVSPVRVCPLEGLGPDEGRKILKDKELVGTEHSWDLLVGLYSGNPLALKLVSQFIREVFHGDIASFLGEGEKFFSDISDVLDQQFGRLPALEKKIMYWLAIEREALSLSALREDMLLSVTMRELQEAQRSLLRRNLVILSDQGFTLQNVVMEYMTNRYVDCICKEIKEERPDLLRTHALMNAQAKDYVRESQLRLLLLPIAQCLIAEESREELAEKCKRMISTVRENTSQDTGYTTGNILNLLGQMGHDLRGYDFSQVTIRNAYLQNVLLPEVSLAHAHLLTSVFRDTFGTILSIAFHPKGDLLAAGLISGEVRVWNIADGELVVKYRRHIGWVHSVTFNSTGNVLASAGHDQTIRLCEARTGQDLLTIQGYPQSIRAIAFSPDGQTLVSSGSDPAIWLWDANTGKCLKRLQGHQGKVRTVVFSSDTRMIVSGGEDRTVRIWDVSTGMCSHVLQYHTDAVRSVALSPDGKFIASGGEDQIICLWETHTGECLHIFDGHSGKVRSVAFNVDGTLLASGGEDHMVRLWEVKTGLCLKTLQGHTDRVRSVAFNTDGTVLASGGEDQTVRLWEVKTGFCLKIVQGYTNWINSVAFHPQGRILASGSDDHTVKLWDVLTGESTAILKGHMNRVWSVAFSPDGQILASGSQDKTIRLWIIKTGTCLKVLQDHQALTYSLAFSPDGKILASGGDDAIIYLWDTNTGQCLSTLKKHTVGVRVVTFSPDGKILASGGDDDMVYLWDTNTGQCLSVLEGHRDTIRSLNFNFDGQLLVSGGNDRTIRIWNINSGKCLKILQGHTRSITTSDLDTRRNILATGGNDDFIRLWNLDTYQDLRLFQGHSDQIRSLAFSPDGDTLASSSSDGTIKLWDTLSGTPIRTMVSGRPYDHLDITGVTGLKESQKSTLKILGAIEQ